MIRYVVASAGFVAIVAASVVPVAAQTVPKPIVGPEGGKITRNRQAPEQLPSAVPGSRADQSLAAPAERVPTDMPPTEALFDAINRGDVVAARDAIGRGADIHGRNVLGLTPLEQSVDLGRSDISFLLLSLRGGAGYSTASGPSAPATAPSATESRAERRKAAQEAARDAARQRREQAIAARDAAQTPSRNARLFAGDGGAPVPQAGFLGFDSAR